MNFDFLKQPYDPARWADLLRHLFGDHYQAALTKFPIDTADKRYREFNQTGFIQLPDTARTLINVYEVILQDYKTRIDLNRVTLATAVDKIRSDAAASGALAVFIDPQKQKWRLTFVAKRETYDADGDTQLQRTEPKRYTYLFGVNENTRTAESRFQLLAGIADKRLDDLLDAFSVEKINREFFDQYKKHYETGWQFLADPTNGAYPVFRLNPQHADDHTRKPLRDFAKRLLGRLVFLYFLQKKGWMGCPADRDNWRDGDPDFVANLFRSLPPDEQSRFYSRHLTRLFFNTLNERRPGDQFHLPDGRPCRVPYLNGGLFDGDVPGSECLDLPAEWFAGVFRFFSQYNFTVDESSPNDHEVGIDPEMLGHIFENLLEENREKAGAYYTPKEIVHYMCQESLLLYLKNALIGLDGKTRAADVIWTDSRAADEQALADFVRLKTRGPKDNFIHKNGPLLERLLHQVRICDPAIGSGAFPMGLLHEIFYCQIELDITQHPEALKKDIIHHCIYGVDKDKGAVDIARLRFWLALVVDEDEPQPLPNLDYKIMQGDSLLESYEGIDLSQLLQNGPAKTAAQLFDTVQEPAVQFGDKDKARLARWLDAFFQPRNSAEKTELQGKIDQLIHREIDDAIRRYKVRLLDALADQRKALDRELALRRPGHRQQKEIRRLETEIERCESQQTALADYQQRDERPYFLWRTWFREVLDAGGFDIVIGNPPYVQLQRLGRYADTLQAAGYDTFVRTGDLYCLFYEQALRLLRPGGILAFITSNSWLKTIYGQPLRRLLAEHSSPAALLNFEDARLFKAAIVETNILIAHKGRQGAAKALAAAIGPTADAAVPLHEQLARHGSPLHGLSEKEWIIGDAASVRLKERMEEGKKRLGELLVTINFGIKTGLNEAFIITETTKNELIAADAKNAEIIKPILRGRDVQRYFYRYENLWLLFTKHGIDIDQFPTVKSFLLQWEERLRPRKEGDTIGRKPGPYKWYEIQDNVAYFKQFEKPKIIWGDMADEPKFVYDQNGFYTNDKCYILTGEKLKYLLGIFNSKASEWYFNQISTTSGMGTTFWKKYKIEQLPIPAATPAQESAVERLVEYVLWAKAAQQAAPDAAGWQLPADYLENVINGCVYELYFPQELAEAGLAVFGHLGELPALPAGGEEPTVRAVFERLFDKAHPVRNALFYLRIVPEVKTILDGLKSPEYPVAPATDDDES